jgi:hypothetical protein
MHAVVVIATTHLKGTNNNSEVLTCSGFVFAEEAVCGVAEPQAWKFWFWSFMVSAHVC